MADVFFNTRPQLELCAPQLLRSELIRHRPRIAKQMRKTVAQVTEVLDLLLHRVTLVYPSLISDEVWKEAKTLVKSVDPDDEDYVALALHLGFPLWTGDKKLANALKDHPVRVLTTADVRLLHAAR